MNTFAKILLVEDDEFDADMTTRVLKEVPLQNEIVWLENGEELLAYLDEHPKENIAFCILDLKMPIMSGIEALEVLKGTESTYPYFPIVVMTSSQESPEVKRCYELGINAFVTKPVQQAEFSTSVKALGAFWGLVNVLPKG